MKTVSLADGKYAYDIDDGQMVAARRHGVDWPTGYADRHHSALVAALVRVAELETIEVDVQEGDVWARIDDPTIQRTVADVDGERVNLASDRWVNKATMATAWRLVRRDWPPVRATLNDGPAEGGILVDSAEAFVDVFGGAVEQGLLRGVRTRRKA